MNFKMRARNSDYKLTEIEDDLVDYILKHKTEVSEMRIVSLAEQFFTVANTITRFCHKLGYSGFSELKLELKHELEEGSLEANLQKKLILRNFDLMDREREHKVCALMKKARAVNFYGLGQTGLAAKICVDNFFALDDKFKFFDYPNELRRKMAQGTGQIFFFISLSGESQAVMELARLAKDSGHLVISLSKLTKNSLAGLSDYSLYCYTVSESINQYDVTDKTPILLIMQSLYQSYLSEFV